MLAALLCGSLTLGPGPAATPAAPAIAGPVVGPLPAPAETPGDAGDADPSLGTALPAPALAPIAGPEAGTAAIEAPPTNALSASPGFFTEAKPRASDLGWRRPMRAWPWLVVGGGIAAASLGVHFTYLGLAVERYDSGYGGAPSRMWEGGRIAAPLMGASVAAFGAAGGQLGARLAFDATHREGQVDEGKVKRFGRVGWVLLGGGALLWGVTRAPYFVSTCDDRCVVASLEAFWLPSAALMATGAFWGARAAGYRRGRRRFAKQAPFVLGPGPGEFGVALSGAF